MGCDAEFEREAADVDGGGALGLPEDAGDGDLLGAEAFCDADGPLAADGGAGSGRLGEDASGRSVGGVEAVFKREAQAEGAGSAAGFGEGEAGERRNLDLVAVNGESHGDEAGDQHHQQHGKRAEEDVEEAVDGGEVEFHGELPRIQGAIVLRTCLKTHKPKLCGRQKGKSKDEMRGFLHYAAR